MHDNYYDSRTHLAHKVRATRLEHGAGMHEAIDPAMCKTCYRAWDQWERHRGRVSNPVPVAQSSGCLSLLAWALVIVFVLALLAR